MFKSIMDKVMDAYIDNMVVKSKRESDHIRNLTELFAIQQKHKLRLNAIKICFGGELKKTLGVLGDETRNRSKSRTNHGNQQPR